MSGNWGGLNSGCNHRPVRVYRPITGSRPGWQATFRAMRQGWNSKLVLPEPLLNKDIKVQVSNQKPMNACPAGTTAQ
jgi:hypothetical protein